MARFGALMRPDYFDSKDEYDVASCILEYWMTYKHPPEEADDVILLLGTDGAKYRDLVYSIFLGLQEWNLTLVSDMLVKFAREQSAKLAVLNSLDDVEKGNLESVVERLRRAMMVGREIVYRGLNLKADADTWLDAAQVEKVPTGLIHLDIAMDGGLAAGELGIILAPPNYGKSMMLVNIGYGAIGPTSGINIVHFTFEISDVVVAKRYGARMTFRFPPRHGDLEEYKRDFIRVADMMAPGEVQIIRVAGADLTVNRLRHHLDILVDEGFDAGMIIVDYGDLMDPIQRRRDRWIELGDIYKDLRELGVDYDCPVWTASQTGRHALNKEVITMSDLAESFKKASIGDAIVALCQTLDEERANQCRLFLAKLRDGKSRAMIRAKFYKEQQAIISTGFVSAATEADGN